MSWEPRSGHRRTGLAFGLTHPAAGLHAAHGKGLLNCAAGGLGNAPKGAPSMDTARDLGVRVEESGMLRAPLTRREPCWACVRDGGKRAHSLHPTLHWARRVVRPRTRTEASSMWRQRSGRCLVGRSSRVATGNWIGQIPRKSLTRCTATSSPLVSQSPPHRSQVMAQPATPIRPDSRQCRHTTIDSTSAL